MRSSAQTGSTALVTGASRGFGRAIASALHAAGAEVVAVGRNGELLASLRDTVTTVVADAADPVVAGTLIEQYRPDTLVLNAGVPPLMRPVQHQTWQTSSRTVVTMSSGAAVAGSTLSGGYAGAKATIRFITSYAADESDRAGLGIRFISLLPMLTPATGRGATAVAAYARRDSVDVDAYLARSGPGLSPEDVGKATVDLVVSAEYAPGAYLLTSAGLSPVG